MARRISVELVGDASSLERSFAHAGRSAKGFERDMKGAVRGAIVGSGAFRSLGRSLALAGGGFLGGVGFAALAKSVVTQASTIQEETEKTGVVFGKNAREVQAWSKTLANSFGVGEGAALKATGVFGNMFHSLGFAAPAAATMSKRLVELAADMASFNNVSPAATLQALSSGLAGQVRPLRQFGVFLTQGRIQSEAYADGLAKVGKKLTANQKTQAAFNIILHDTKLQQGDVARNTGSLSVSLSKLKANLQDAEAVIGRALLPSLVKLANKTAAYVEHLRETGQLQRDVTHVAKDFGKAMHDLAALAHAVAAGFRAVNRVTGSTEGTLKLLGGAFVALKLRAFAAELGLVSAGIFKIGTSAAAATPEVNAFKTAAERPNFGPGSFRGGGGGFPFIIPAGGNPIPNRDLREPTGPGLGSRLAGGAGGLLGLAAGAFVLGGGIKGAKQRIRDGWLEVSIDGKHFSRFQFIGSKQASGAPLPFPFPFRPGLKTDPTVTPTAPPTGRAALSLQGRFNLLELTLAKVGLTASKKDDRAILVQEAAIKKEQATRSKVLKDRTGLYQQLGQIEDQIAGIDQAAAQKEKDTRAKAAERAKKAAEKAARAAATFSVPLALQLAGARADAFAALHPTAFGDPTKLQLSIARKVKASALKAIRSGTKSMQGLIDAWNEIASINQQLATRSKGAIDTYHAVSTRALTAGLGLSRDQRLRVEERMAQRAAHRGYAPSGPAALGQGITITGPVTVTGVQNIDQLEKELRKKSRQRAASRTAGRR